MLSLSIARLTKIEFYFLYNYINALLTIMDNDSSIGSLLSQIIVKMSPKYYTLNTCIVCKKIEIINQKLICEKCKQMTRSVINNMHNYIKSKL